MGQRGRGRRKSKREDSNSKEIDETLMNDLNRRQIFCYFLLFDYSLDFTITKKNWMDSLTTIYSLIFLKIVPFIFIYTYVYFFFSFFFFVYFIYFIFFFEGGALSTFKFQNKKI